MDFFQADGFAVEGLTEKLLSAVQVERPSVADSSEFAVGGMEAVVSFRVVALLAFTCGLNALAHASARAQDPCPPFQRPRGDWGSSYQEPDSPFILNFPLVKGDPSIRVGADGNIWTYEGKLLAVRWERATLTRERLARFLAAHRARLLGALPDREPSWTTCVLQFPVAPSLPALDSLADVVRRWPGVLSAEPVRRARAGHPSPADSIRRP